MSSYVSTQLPLSKLQKAKIVSAMKKQQPIAIRLSAKALASRAGGVPMLVTTQQAKKITSSVRKRVGAQINLSAALLKANMKKGSGLLGSIARSVVRPIAHSGIDFLASAGSAAAKKGIDKLVGAGYRVKRKRKAVRGRGLFGSIARAVVKPIAHTGIDFLSGAVTGAAKAGVNKLVGEGGRRRRRTKRAGKGLVPPGYRI